MFSPNEKQWNWTLVIGFIPFSKEKVICEKIDERKSLYLSLGALNHKN